MDLDFQIDLWITASVHGSLIREISLQGKKNVAQEEEANGDATKNANAASREGGGGFGRRGSDRRVGAHGSGLVEKYRKFISQGGRSSLSAGRCDTSTTFGLVSVVQ